MSDDWIRASEIGDYMFCRHSWWLKRVAGKKSQNFRSLQRGSSHHQQHANQLERSESATRLAYAVVAIAAAIFVFALIALL